MAFFDKPDKPKRYKIDMIQESDTKEIVYGLYIWKNSLGGYYDLRFVFPTEQEAIDFIEKLKDYPKFMDSK